MIYARVAGTGSFLPGEPVSNDDLVARGIDTSDEWIIERTGIRSRHLAAPEVTASELAWEASRRAIEAAGCAPADIDLVIVATSTPDFIFPSTAALLQARLGIVNGGAAFDLQAVCTGFVYALATAEKFIRSGSHKRALVVLEASEKPGILASALHADGSHNPILCVPGQVNRGAVTGDPFLRMDGQAVFKFAVKVLGEVAREVAQQAGMPLDSVDWLIPHQANIRILQATAKRVGVSMDKVIATVAAHGNTSAASIPLALDLAVRDGRVQRGQKLLLEGVGGGFTWGAVLLEY